MRSQSPVFYDFLLVRFACYFARDRLGFLSAVALSQARINTELERDLGEDAAPAKLLSRLLQVTHT